MTNVHFVSTVYPLVKGTAGSAGYDVSSIDDTTVPPGERQLIHTGVFLHSCPPDYYVRIAPRSGLAAKYGIDVFAGVIDSDYRGEVVLVLFNSDTASTLVVNSGDRVAQLIVTRIAPDDHIVLEHMFDRRTVSPPEEKGAVVEPPVGDPLPSVPARVMDATQTVTGTPFFQTRGTSGFGSTGVLNQRDQQLDRQPVP
jgi:dUTP pyrophosphatase